MNCGLVVSGVSEIFRAMNTKTAEHAALEPRLPNWVNGFPYMGSFAGGGGILR